MFSYVYIHSEQAWVFFLTICSDLRFWHDSITWNHMNLLKILENTVRKAVFHEGLKLLDLSKQNKIFKIPGIHHESVLPNLPFKEVYDVSDKTGKNFPTFQHLPISINKCKP